MKELTKRQREQLERQDTIIEKAEYLFCKHGFENVSMDDLAREVELTKRTIYRYFASKEDLYFAIALRGYHRLYDMIIDNSLKGNTGFEKIRLTYYTYYEFFCKFPGLNQLINMGGVIKSDTKDKNLPYRKQFLEFDKQLFDELIEMFMEGKVDGSIRSDVDITHLALSSIFVTSGFFQMLSLSGETYTEHFNLNQNDFVDMTIEILLDSLKNKKKAI
ncbi:TetR/AcrR family transcriptional regulator [Vallitalea okinawensis]|uniref:TetR/AcrR family transcriptional regulator n=1 Tax=Vallitalea okinawensis TaxID=2078660 RepID=UPI000CFB3229|nr:TetR/AcrR family transcriptional regulator [Vallitalea okinawensis]